MSLSTANVAVGVFLDCVLFPLTFTELLDSIEKNGYILNQGIPIIRPLGRFRGSGQIGIKGKNAFHVDAGDKSLVVFGVSLEEVKSEYNTFCSTLLEDYSIDVDEMAKFYQFSANYELKTDQNPYEAISKSYESPNQGKISEILGHSIKTYAVRLGTSETVPIDVDWFDIKITPDIQKNDGYMIEAVYRNQDKEKYQEFSEAFEANIIEIIKIIEE